MPTILIIWLVFCGMAVVAWVLRHRDISRAIREDRKLTPRSYEPIPAGSAPRLSVLVAAKDEEANIETCVRTLLAQEYPDFDVVAVNDRSSDATGEILDRLAEEADGRLKVVHVRHLRDGWFGKNNAMREGVAQSSASWLCFVDADCRQTSNATLSVAMQEALDHNVDFLSVLPVLETRSFWERVIQPVCGAVLVLWFNPSRVNDPKSSAAYANGAFMMMTRENYDAIGGHEAVRSELNEDIQMARRTKSIGRRLFVIRNDGLYLTRMYSTFRDSWRGWSRIFYGSFRSFRKLAVSLTVLILMSVVPFVGAAACGIGALAAEGEVTRWWSWGLGASLAVIAVLESVIYRFMKLSQAVRWAWITYPLGATLALGILVTSLSKQIGAPTTWRGTTYSGDRRAEPAASAPQRLAEAPAGPATDVG